MNFFFQLKGVGLNFLRKFQLIQKWKGLRRITHVSRDDMEFGFLSLFAECKAHALHAWNLRWIFSSWFRNEKGWVELHMSQETIWNLDFLSLFLSHRGKVVTSQLVLTDGGNQSTQQKPLPSPKSLVTFSHAPARIQTRTVVRYSDQSVAMPYSTWSSVIWNKSNEYPCMIITCKI